jgi:hypothetical protein
MRDYMTITRVIEVLHNDCVYESSDSTKSIHKSKRGAAKAMVDLKIERWNDPYYRNSMERFSYRVSILRP